jgi:hypothetical protein
MVIQVSFSDLPQIQLEEDVDTTLSSENLLDANWHLTIKKVFPIERPDKPKTILIVNDFEDTKYQNLCSKKETDLNKTLQSLGLEPKSGASNTNK